jgi:hypothetical protein
MGSEGIRVEREEAALVGRKRRDEPTSEGGRRREEAAGACFGPG